MAALAALVTDKSETEDMKPGCPMICLMQDRDGGGMMIAYSGCGDGLSSDIDMGEWRQRRPPGACEEWMQ